MFKRKATSKWNGGLKSGKGEMQLGGGSYKGGYSFSSRFEEGGGTNPEELIAAAHSGCFSMAFAGALEKNGFNPESVNTTAYVHLDKNDDGFFIARVHLETEAKVAGIEDEKFQEVAEKAKTNCPVSKVLKGAEITLEAKLVK